LDRSGRNPESKSFEFFDGRFAGQQDFRGDDATLDPKKEVRNNVRSLFYVPAPS